MSTAYAEPVDGPAPDRHWTGGRVVVLVAGLLLAALSIAVGTAGMAAFWANNTKRGDLGYIATDPRPVKAPGAALVLRPSNLQVPRLPWLSRHGLLGNVRVSAVNHHRNAAIFIGLAPSNQVQRYLGAPGTRPAPPTSQRFWLASKSGYGKHTLEWTAKPGKWSVVLMNLNGHRGISVSYTVGATMPFLGWLTAVLLLAAFGLLVAGCALVFLAARAAGQPAMGRR